MKLTVKSSTGATGRKFSLLGAGGFLVITLIQIPNLADLWEQRRSHFAHRAEMLAGFAEPQRSSALDQQLGQVRLELAALQQSMVDIARMPAIQSELMELARDSGCQLRKAVIQAGSSENWEAEPDHPGGPDEEAGYANGESPYVLTTEQLSLSLTGTLEQTFDFLDRVRQRPWLMRVAQINFSREPDGRGQLNVEANLAFYKMVKKAPVEEELVQWRDGSRAAQVH